MMISGFKRFWIWLQRNHSQPPAPPSAPTGCCPECRTSDDRMLADKLAHLVRKHLSVEERWLLKILFSNYHLNDLCALLGAGPDTVRYRVATLRAKIMVLLHQQNMDDCVKRTFHRMISGPWF